MKAGASGPLLLVFLRWPAPGRAKTRLVPALGASGAALLQHDLTTHVLRVARAAARRCGGRVEVRCTGAAVAAVRQRYGAGCACVDQGEGDLGARLERAFAAAFAAGRGPVLAIGTDCPALTVEAIADACARLRTCDVVLGPAADGGYWLLGLRAMAPPLFHRIAWGTRDVLAQTLRAAAAEKLRVELLEERTDVDTAADLRAWHDTLPHESIAQEPECVAVTGATGSLGARFVAAALRHWPRARFLLLVRDRARAVTTGLAPLLAREGRRLELVAGDLCAPVPAALAPLLEADGGVWHFAACTALLPRSAAGRARIWAVNDAGTARLLELLAARAAAAPLFHVSTAYVCGRRTGRVHEETLDADAGCRNDYEASKRAAELRVRAAFGGGLRGAILRPSVVVADTLELRGGIKIVDRIGAAIANAVRRRERELTLRAPADGAINAVRASWVARAMLELAGSTDGRTFHLTARRPLLLADLARAAERVAGLRIALDPSADPAALRGASRVADRDLARLRGYLVAGPRVEFARGNFERRAAEAALADDLDLEALLRARLSPAAAARTASGPAVPA